MFNLYIQHGRRTPDQKLADWGENGPILPNCIGIHSIYGNISAYFASEHDAQVAERLTGWELQDENGLLLKFEDYLLIARFRDGSSGFFGDWGLEPMKYFGDDV